MVVGLGIAIVDLADLRARLNEASARRLFLPGETGYADTQARPWESLGARLAAKQAVLRGLCVDVETRPPWLEVEVGRSEAGEPSVRMSGGTLELADRLGVTRCRVSMSHTRRTALAVAVLEDGTAASDLGS